MIHLVTPDRAMLDAALTGPDAIGEKLESAVASNWQVFPDAVQHARNAVVIDPGNVRWGMRLFVLEVPRTLVGLGGFKGYPYAGVVELGYAVAPSFEGRGIATAAVRELIADAFSDPQVTAIIAHTLGEDGPSPRVLEKTGFVRDGDGPEHDGVATWRFRLARPSGKGHATTSG